jgi:predicted permease
VLPIALEFDGRPDIRVLAATMALAGLSTLVFGLGPALTLSRLEVVDNLKATAGESGDRASGRRFGTRNLLVVGQLALSLLLLTCGGLFARGALKAAATDPGFSLDRELLVAVDPSLAGYGEVRGRATYRAVLDRLRGLPGIDAVGFASTVPFGDVQEGQPVERPGATTPADLRGPIYMIVGADYFKALGLRMLRGHEFTREEEQSATAPRAAIIDEPLARQLFANEDPIGRQIRIVPRPDSGASGLDTQPMEIVGVAPGLRFALFDRSPVPHLYVSSGRHYRANMNLHVRVAGGDTASMLATIRRELKSTDDRLPVLQLTTMSQFRDRSAELWAVQAGGRVFLTFGALALLLAVVGVYGVKSYLVSRRTREIGIRMALGAGPADVLWLVLREGLSLTGAGLAIGLLLAAASGRLMASLLYQVSPIDPVVFTISPLLLAAAATIACYVPARRATKVHPITALRAD